MSKTRHDKVTKWVLKSSNRGVSVPIEFGKKRQQMLLGNSL